VELFPSTTIKSKKNGPRGLIIAGVHGDEYEPILAVLQLIGELEGKLECGTLTLVPIVNKNAYLTASRAAEDGLDLARTCPGNPNGSITEKIAYDISSLIQNSDFLIDMHTGGMLFDISPLAGYVLHPSTKVLTIQREMAKAFNLPKIWGTSPELEGRTLSVARDAKVPAIYTEYGGGKFRHEHVPALVSGCKNVLSYFNMLTLETPLYKIESIVEDNSPQSGHLQILHPAPEEGFFVAEVKLEQHVKKNDIIGHILNYQGEKKDIILAEKEGLVFLLRAVPNVLKGDAIAGIFTLEKSDKVDLI